LSTEVFEETSYYKIKKDSTEKRAKGTLAIHAQPMSHLLEWQKFRTLVKSRIGQGVSKPDAGGRT
jgi:hypothetical protein